MVRRLYSHQKDSLSRLDVTVYYPYAKLMIMEWIIYEMDNGGLEKYDTQVISETHLNITKER